MQKKPLSYSQGIGNVYLLDGKISANSEVVKILSVDDIILTEYIYHYLNNQQLNIQRLAKYTTNLGHVEMTKFKQLKIPIPSPEIQQKVIAIYEQKEQELVYLTQRVRRKSPTLNR